MSEGGALVRFHDWRAARIVCEGDSDRVIIAVRFLIRHARNGAQRRASLRLR